MDSGRQCLFQGEIYYVVGEAYDISPNDENEEDFLIFLALNKVECAAPIDTHRIRWKLLEEVTLLLSSHNFRETEWYRATHNE